MTLRSNSLATRRVVIGGQAYDKPWDRDCGACRSPWLAQIDGMLAEGYALRTIRKHLAGLRPAVPNEPILRSHIRHLAEPHRKARLTFEEAAEARGDDTTTSGATASDALNELIRQGQQALVHGELDLQARDLTRAIQLQMQLDRSRASEGVEASQWQAAMIEFFEISRRIMKPEQWSEFVSEVYASPVIRGVLADAAPALPGGERSSA
jgi:hypothetical protein